MSRRITIERLHLDMRGVDPQVAHEAVAALPAALRAAVAAPAGDGADRRDHEGRDAGRVPSSGDARVLARSVAAALAGRVRRA